MQEKLNISDTFLYMVVFCRDYLFDNPLHIGAGTLGVLRRNIFVRAENKSSYCANEASSIKVHFD